MEYTEEFARERNLIYEPNATPDKEPVIAIPIEERIHIDIKENPIIKEKISPVKIIIPLFIIGVISGILAGIFHPDILSNESLYGYLTMRINEGFIGSFCSCFVCCVCLLLPVFLSGLCAVGKIFSPLPVLLYGIGTGIAFARVIEIYGGSGIIALLLLFLPRVILLFIAGVYLFKCSVMQSDRIMGLLMERENYKDSKSAFSAYLYRSVAVLLGALGISLIDGAISLFAGNLFII